MLAADSLQCAREHACTCTPFLGENLLSLMLEGQRTSRGPMCAKGNQKTRQLQALADLAAAFSKGTVTFQTATSDRIQLPRHRSCAAWRPQL
jgi:hypothetical protein